MGVWIETGRGGRKRLSVPVTPFVGVWIETEGHDADDADKHESHPSWVCGLKHRILLYSMLETGRHTLRGCVD